MYRVWLLFVGVGMSLFLLGGSGAVSGQDEKKSEDKKEEKKKEETLLGKTVGEWIKILRTHDEARWRRAALKALEATNSAGRTGLPAVLDAIEKDKEPGVRQEAVMLLGRLTPTPNGAFKALVAALQTDKSDAVREAAATTIGADKFVTQAPDYISALVDALKDPHAGTRVAVAGALRNMGESAKPAFPALFDAAKNPKEHGLVRVAAVHVLSRHDKENPQLLPLLLDLANKTENTSALRETAIDGLSRVGSGSSEVVTALCRTLDTDKSLEVRKAAAVALGGLGQKAKAGWPTIKAHMNDAKEESSIRNHLIRLAGVLAKTNAEAIPALTEAAVNDKSTENRIAAIQELGELGTQAKASIDALRNIASQDARAAIREAASKALKQISAQ